MFSKFLKSGQDTRVAVRPQLFICGDLCNLGDLALLLQNVQLRDEGSKRFYVRIWAPLPEEIEAAVTSRGGELLRGKQLFRSLMVARQCDIVIGGGQLIRNNSSLTGISYLLACCITARLSGGSVTTRGLGVSKLSGARRTLYRIMLSLAQRINVRDAASRANIESLSLGKYAATTADMLFFPTALHADLREDHGLTRRSILVSPCVDAGEGRSIVGPNFLDLIHSAQTALPGSNLIFVCHDIRPGMDIDAAKKLIAESNIDAQIHDAPSLEKLIDLYRSASFVITNRMHSLIIALLTGAPAVVVDDGAKKIDAIANEFQIHKVDVSRGTHDKYASVVDSSLKYDRHARAATIDLVSKKSAANLRDRAV